MSGWIVFGAALVAMVSVRLIVYRVFGAAWTTGRFSGRRAGIVLAVIAGIVPLAAGLWLAMFSEDRLAGVLLVGIWLIAYLPLAIALTRYMERYGVLEEMRRRRRPGS